MASRLVHALAGSLCLVLCDGSVARAYCRTHTLDTAAQDCPSSCQEKGFALAWGTPDIEYVFNERGFPGLSDSALRSVFADSFNTWEIVSCGSQSVGVSSHAASGTTKAESGHSQAGPNENVILHYDAAAWAARSYSSQAFAITAVWYNARDGEILGADMMFNGGMDLFGVCPASGCRASDVDTDLQNVATHEIGHMLGLSHSDVPVSTMWCDADTREVSKRDLAADDIAGLCAIYPPGGATVDGGGTGVDDDRDEGCALAPAATAWGLVPVLAALLARRRRRRGGER